MRLRQVATTFAFVSVAFAQDLPSFQWMKEVDASGLNSSSLAGLGTDAQGNIYIAGTTSSTHFPVKNALQPAAASAGLYRLSGGAWSPLGLSYGGPLVLDPQNPARIYTVSKGVPMKSADGGVTFAPLTLPASQVYSIAIEPGNDQILFAAIDHGVLKSADAGATWTAVNNGVAVGNGGTSYVSGVWIDPANRDVIFAETPNGLLRSADGAASWQITALTDSIQSIAFDPGKPGTLYAATNHSTFFRSVDDGQTFASLSVPRGIYEVLPDPIQPGRLIGAGAGFYQSTDGGATWVQVSGASVSHLVADPDNGVYYAMSLGTGMIRISVDLQTVTTAGPWLSPNILLSLAVVNGQVYAAMTGSTDVFVTKLDPAGNILYSTYLGGSGVDQASAITVDAGGNVFVAGTTNSADFPVSQGAYASSGTMFLTRLNPNGSLGYSTYFSGTTPAAIVTDGSGSAWLLGNSTGQLPVTPGALAPDFCCAGPPLFFGPPSEPEEATLTRFSPSGSSLSFSTYVPGSSADFFAVLQNPANALALGPDGSAYVGGFFGIFRIDSAGSTLLGSTNKTLVTPQAMALAPDGSLYVAGPPDLSQGSVPFRSGIVRMDAVLSNILASTWFGANAQVRVMTTDVAGHVYIGGSNVAWFGLPTRTPFAGGFATPTGFLSEFSGDLSTLLFSSYFGNTESFTVSGLGIGEKGDVIIGGVTQTFVSLIQGNIWLNSLVLTPPPALRIDSVVNAASLIDGPLSSGETIFIRGAGFGDNTQLLIGETPVTPLSISPTVIIATVPDGLPAVAAAVEVRSGGVGSNSVLMPTAATSPGIFSQDGSGSGQAYILNKDGTPNSPSNPARPGERFTIFATGVGPMTFTDCCAVTEYPVTVLVDNLFCPGVAAVLRPVNGLPGNVYQITMYVPDPIALPGDCGQNFRYPAQSTVILQVNGIYSQFGTTISIAQ